MTLQLHHGDCLDVLCTMADGSVDAVVTDPPYGLAFMGKRWDYDVPSVEIWAECLRVLKPGGHLLAFAGTRTQHRMAVRIEDAGFEIRDMIAWVYGSGFPKSLDISKQLNRIAGAEREVVGSYTVGGTAAKGKHKVRAAVASDEGSASGCTKELNITAPATPEARQWAGWGTALKPALEPITMARKPLEGTVAANVLQWGTGGLNVDGCRIDAEPRSFSGTPNRHGGQLAGGGAHGEMRPEWHETRGRWPANLIHDGSDEVLGLFPETVSGGDLKPYENQSRNGHAGVNSKWKTCNFSRDASGSAARFFYTSKASRDDRDDGNNHPTVKPTDLMRYLCRLVTPSGGIVLDPFMGSGSTGKAAMLEGFGFIGIEREAAYHAIAERRVRQAAAAGHQPSLLALA